MSATRSITSLQDTRRIAENLASKLRCGDVVTLAGDVGAGKTTFTQFLIRALSPDPVEVTSPTFTLVQSYPVRLADGSLCELYHYDLYRIEHPSALKELGLDETEGRITLIEWPERLGGYRLPITLAISLTLHEDGSRVLAFASTDVRFTDEWL